MQLSFMLHIVSFRNCLNSIFLINLGSNPKYLALTPNPTDARPRSYHLRFIIGVGFSLSYSLGPYLNCHLLLSLPGLAGTPRRVHRQVGSFDPSLAGPAGVGMTFLAAWLSSIFPELQRVPGTALDQRRSTWVLLHASLRRVRRARLLVDFLSQALLERRAEFIGR